MGRAPCCEKVGLKRGPWTPDEDEKLVSFINEHGHGSWRALPKKAGLLRCGKSCRLRWTNYLRPDIKRGEFSASEENVIVQLHRLLGNRWSAIASHLPRRTDNEIKNYWNTYLKKKLLKMGLDPTTHKPLADTSLTRSNGGGLVEYKAGGTQPGMQLNRSSSDKSSAVHSGMVKSDTGSDVGNGDSAASMLLRGASFSQGTSANSVIIHLTQWETVRLEAEARLVQEAKMRAKGVWGNNQRMNPVSSVKAASLSRSIMHAGGQGLGALKVVSAVDLMHALHNWEKSLQGQAGLLWPESWTQAAAAAGAASHSCCGGNSESSSSSSPSAVDAAPATSSASLCSLDSRSRPMVEQIPGTAEAVRPCGSAGKLSWSDSLMPSSYTTPPPVQYTVDHELCTKLERSRQGTFSSLMLDAVLGRCLVQQGTMSSAASVESPKVEEAKQQEAPRGAKEEEINPEDMTSNEKTAADQAQHVVDEASNASAVTGEMLEEVHIHEDDDDGNEDDSQNEQSPSGDGTSDLFKDLPRLKRDASAPPVSYTALLSEEISDYWSSMVLKEQVSSPTIHITF